MVGRARRCPGTARACRGDGGADGDGWLGGGGALTTWYRATARPGRHRRPHRKRRGRRRDGGAVRRAVFTGRGDSDSVGPELWLAGSAPSGGRVGRRRAPRRGELDCRDRLDGACPIPRRTLRPPVVLRW